MLPSWCCLLQLVYSHSLVVWPPLSCTHTQTQRHTERERDFLPQWVQCSLLQFMYKCTYKHKCVHGTYKPYMCMHVLSMFTICIRMYVGCDYFLYSYSFVVLRASVRLCVCMCVWTLVGGCQRSVSSLAAQLLLAYVQYVPYICKSACMHVCMYVSCTCTVCTNMYVCLCIFTQKCSIAILFRIKHAVLVWDTQLDFARSTSLLAAAFFVCARRQRRQQRQRQRQRQRCALCTERTGCVSFSVFVLFRFIPFHVACSMPLLLLVSCKILLCLLILIRFFAFAALTTCAR